MTERREKRNEEIRTLFSRIRNDGTTVSDALDMISDGPYGLSPETVRRIVYDKNYCRKKNKCLENIPKNYLADLSQEQLDYVAAVMYGSRQYITEGEVRPLEELLSDVKVINHLDAQMEEKMPLHEYLTAGMEIYKI